jgi:hypothetical protein
VSNEAKTYVGYIRDLAYLLRERIVEAQVEKEKSGSAFEEGREFGLRQALASMQHQADAFGIPRDEICLAGFEAMTEPVDPPPRTPVESRQT